MNRIAFAPILVLALGLAACGDVEAPTPGALPDTTRADTLAAGTAGTRADTVDVTLVDFEIQMPSTLSAGPVVFSVRNDGSEVHNFEVEGQGIEEELESDLQPGQSGTLRVDLQPGTYHVYCPVADHEERGMELQLTVNARDGAGMGS